MTQNTQNTPAPDAADTLEGLGVRYSLKLGLTTEQANASREQHGRNVLTPPAREPWWKELLKKFDDPTIKILIVAAVLSLLVTVIEKWGLHNEDASFIDSIGIFLAVALATLVGFFSERKSAKEFEALNKIKEDVPIKVVRDGQLDKISIHDIVVGDVVRLDSGDKLPADGVLLETTNLYVDQATFTGESVPVRKAPTSDAWNLEALAALAKLGNDDFVARGTTVADGRGWYLVTSVGDATEMGKIADALSTVGIDDSKRPDANSASWRSSSARRRERGDLDLHDHEPSRRVQVGRRRSFCAKRQRQASQFRSFGRPLGALRRSRSLRIRVPVKSKLVRRSSFFTRLPSSRSQPAFGE